MSTNPTTKGMSEAEVLAVLHEVLQRHHFYRREDADNFKAAIATIESIFAELREAHELLVGVGEAQIFAIRRAEKAVSDRSELIAMVERLLPYAWTAGTRYDDIAALDTFRDAKLLLSRIQTDPVTPSDPAKQGEDTKP
jgi:hypothetical protein